MTRMKPLIATLFLISSCSFCNSCFSNRFIESNLKPYTSFNLPNEPAVVETAPLDAAVTTRMVQNSGQDSYVNVKVEILPAESFGG